MTSTTAPPHHPPSSRAPLPVQIIGREFAGAPDIERERRAREVTRVHRSRRAWPCRVCDGTDSNCITYPDPARPQLMHVWCVNAAGRDDGLHLPNWGFRQDKGGAWYFLVDETTGQSRRPRPTPTTRREHPLADAATIDRVLRATARALGLSDAHRAKLTARGYDPATCGPDARHRFASLPSDLHTRMAVAAKLMEAFAGEAELLGTFGYEQDRRRRECSIAFLPAATGAALLEFVVGPDGALVGFQYAPDTPPCDAKGKPLKRLSPARMSMTDRCHVARPAQDAGGEVWHTEAIHKANLTAAHRGAIALGSLGAGNAQTLVAAALAVDPEARRLHVVALDADQWGGAAEKRLAGRLADAGCRVALARWDAAHKGPDDAIAAGAELTLEPFEDARSKPRVDRRITHAHDWQRREETQADRDARLQEAADGITARVRAHVATDERTRVLIVTASPGLGKSTAVSALGAPTTAQPLGEIDTAWIAERHDMRASVGALRQYRHIRAPSPANCPTPELHAELARRGYNTGPLHAGHDCEYFRQFQDEGSAFYQIAHASTEHITAHGLAVVDEFNISNWLCERSFRLGDLAIAAGDFVDNAHANAMLRALQAVITDAIEAEEIDRQAGRNPTRPHGRALFEMLDRRCQGRLAAVLATLQDDRRATELRPYPVDIDPYDPDLAQAERLRPVILPHIWWALFEELLWWQRGGDWNSRVRVGPSTVGGEWALYITRTREFGPPVPSRPPRVVLDATADEEIHRRILGAPVEIAPARVDPPPHMRHIAVRARTNKGALKRWGKVSLTQQRHQESRERGLKRTAAELRYLLAELDPDGSLRTSGAVGLITHQGCEQELAEAVGIRYVDPSSGDADEGCSGHFWAMRGSNRLEECAILLVVGTPTPNPEDVKRWARAIYFGDSEPLDDTTEETADGWRYQDARLQRFADYLSRAELTQCAHRNRPLRYDGRTVVTLCAGAVDFLPITTEITSLPQLEADGTTHATKRAQQTAERLEKAAAELRSRGEKVTARALAAAAGLSLTDVCSWSKARYVHLQALQEVQYSSYCKSCNTVQIPSSAPPPSSSSSSAPSVGMPSGATTRPARAVPSAADALEASPDADSCLPDEERQVAPRQPLWSDAMRVAGWGASDEEVMRAWRRLRVEASAAQVEARGEAS